MEVHIGIIMSASILRVARKLSKDVMSQEYPRFEMRFFHAKRSGYVHILGSAVPDEI